jgi:hypothetical protein
MNKLQASMRDKSAKTWRERTVMYKVGSPMKGCNHCGDVEVSESGRLRYTSGFQVFRAYRPWETGWTWKCQFCGAIDLQCWAPDALGLNERELGKEPILGARDVVKAKKDALRRDARLMADPPERREPEDLVRIRELEAELERLVNMLKGGK